MVQSCTNDLLRSSGNGGDKRQVQLMTCLQAIVEGLWWTAVCSLEYWQMMPAECILISAGARL